MGDVALREVAQIRTLVADLDRVGRILDSNIATGEDRDPIFARVRRDNLKNTIAALEKRVSGLEAHA
jgi:hypothetical protein